jgi:hypothetical protein
MSRIAQTLAKGRPIGGNQGRPRVAARLGPIISFGHANDTTGIDIKLDIHLPKNLCVPFPTFRTRQNHPPAAHHHLRIGNTA